MHHWTDLAESFLKMYSFAMLRTAGQKLYQIYHCVHYFNDFLFLRNNEQVSGKPDINFDLLI